MIPPAEKMTEIAPQPVLIWWSETSCFKGWGISEFCCTGTKKSLTFWTSTVEKCIVPSVSHESISRFAILRHRGLCPTPPSRGDRLILRSKTSVKFTIVSERGYYRTVFLPKTADNARTSSFKCREEILSKTVFKKVTFGTHIYLVSVISNKTTPIWPAIACAPYRQCF